MQNRVVVITGASSGIGAACAYRLARSSRLVLVARRQDRLHEVAQRIRDEGGSVHCISADLCHEDTAQRVVDEALATFGGIDVLVNNAGIFATNPLADCDATHVAHVLKLNVEVPILLTRAAMPQLIANGGGWVINISSIAATQVFSGCGVYAASKAALDQWSAVIREELRAVGVRVSVVAPGATHTEAWGSRASAAGMSRAEDVAQAVAYCLDQAPTVSVDRVNVTPPAGPL